VKIKTVPFELDDSPVVKRKSAGGSTPASERKELLYRRNDFLAVRNDQGMVLRLLIFLCGK